MVLVERGVSPSAAREARARFVVRPSTVTIGRDQRPGRSSVLITADERCRFFERKDLKVV